MANKVYSSTPLLGVAWDTKDLSATGSTMAVGTVVSLNAPSLQGLTGHFAMYVRANGAIGASAFVTIDTSTTAIALASSVTSGTSSGFARNGSVAFADGDYGWVFITKTALPQGDIPPNNPNP